MPPAPSGDWISYGPSLVPAVRAIRARHYIPGQYLGERRRFWVCCRQSGHWHQAKDLMRFTFFESYAQKGWSSFIRAVVFRSHASAYPPQRPRIKLEPAGMNRPPGVDLPHRQISKREEDRGPSLRIRADTKPQER